jgi:UDP-N-acetyl-2-amino-2-deoxyglucuronate dehydrogenase
VNQIEHWAFADERSDDAEVNQASYKTTSVYGFGHPPFYANMVDALQGQAEALCDGREGLRSLELLIGAYRSARDQRTVHLPLEY